MDDMCFLQRRFYGPKERRLNLLIGMLRISTYTSTYAASRKIKEGDVKGEGRILGGMLLKSVYLSVSMHTLVSD